MDTALDTLRLALLISLPIVLLALLYKRFRQRVLQRDRPAPQHTELIGLEVAYHPARVRAWVLIPGKSGGQVIHTALLDQEHTFVFQWPEERLSAGEHWIERTLEARANGDHYFQIGTATQRTERHFRLQQV